MPIRKRTIDLARDYVDRHFYSRYIFPIKPGGKFPPLIKNNLEDASNDPAQLEAWEKQWPGCNWGVAHRKSKLLVADVDTNKAKGKIGQLTYDDLDLMFGWPETETTVTPSGGFHMVYEGWADDSHPEHIMALGENGIGKDIDSPNYTLIPGCTFDDGTSYVGNDVEAVKCPEWIYDTIKKAKVKSRITDAGDVVVELDQQRNIDIAIDFLKTDAEPSIQGQGGDANLLKTAYYLKDFGISQQLGAELLNEYFNPRCQPPWDMADLERKMAGAYTYANLSKVGGKTAEADFADDPAPKITPMGVWNAETKSYVIDRKRIKRQIKERADARKRDAGKPDDPDRAKTRAEIIDRWVWIVGMERFINKVDPKGGNARDEWRKTQFDSEFNKIICPKRGSASDTLFRQKKGSIVSYYRAGFKPGQPQTLDGGQTFNLYRDPDVIPEEGDVTWWNEHLEYLFPDETYRNHLLNWMGWLLQNLPKKPKHALIIQGEINGTGKSFIGKVLTSILHTANVSIVPQNGLSGRFNGWALQCKLILVEELRAADRAAVKEALHDIITEDRINVEKKGIDGMMVDTCFGVLAFTNDDAALALDNTDRRYLVVRTDAVPRDAAYYVNLFAKLEDPAAMAAVAYTLMNRDLAGYSGQQSAPMTEAKSAMKKSAMTDLEHWLDENRVEWPLSSRLVTIEDVVTMLPRRLETKGVRLHSSIRKFLTNELGGVELGQCTTPTGKRPRLFAINGSAGILAGQPRSTAGAFYEDDIKKAKSNLPLDDLGEATSEFGDE
jgi:hypothetical protein